MGQNNSVRTIEYKYYLSKWIPKCTLKNTKNTKTNFSVRRNDKTSVIFIIVTLKLFKYGFLKIFLKVKYKFGNNTYRGRRN